MRILIATAMLTLAAASAFAQNADQNAQTGPQNKAVKGVHENNSAAPVKGANSFTRAEAQQQIEAKGYTHVAGLTKDKDGIWRGTAEKNGQNAPVSVDYQGNVN
jgi:hypothetical protein